MRRRGDRERALGFKGSRGPPPKTLPGPAPSRRRPACRRGSCSARASRERTPPSSESLPGQEPAPSALNPPRSPYGGLRWLLLCSGVTCAPRQRWQGLQSPDGWSVQPTRPWVWPLGVSRCAGAAEVVKTLADRPAGSQRPGVGAGAQPLPSWSKGHSASACQSMAVIRSGHS